MPYLLKLLYYRKAQHKSLTVKNVWRSFLALVLPADQEDYSAAEVWAFYLLVLLAVALLLVVVFFL
ncbi:hypothetical protein [Rufibacter sp. LB8]|uniref:hypothetical protein n=1 Tax=Rufibacter sp. LB8 TaxID=2777781 RepID=UPI00178C6322|nr:hypothetical protein [Rufibacter sp. LB8]